MLRIGLVGIGDAGRHHARALARLSRCPDVAWTALVGRDPEKLARFRDALAAPPEVRGFSTYEAMLAEDACDAVILATPDGLHPEQVEAAAARGLHVLVEKPLALELAAGARALDAARRAGVALAVGYHLRHHVAHQWMHRHLAERVGALRSVLIRWAWPDPATEGWRARGEGARFWSLAALGTHGIDLALRFGGVPEDGELRVAALRRPARGVDRAAEVSFTLACGALAHVSVSVEHRATSLVQLTGELGELEAQGTLGARGGGALLARTPRGEVEPIPFIADDPYVAQLKAFVATAPGGYRDDRALLTNLTILHRTDEAPCP